MAIRPHPTIAFWRKALAYSWYAWGLSCCAWGLRLMDTSFHHAGVAAFTRAIQSWPGFARAFYRRGIIRGRELNEHEQAIDDLSQAITLAPEWAEPYLQRGLMHRFHYDHPAALADLERYLAIGGVPYWRSEAARQIEELRADLDTGAAGSEPPATQG